MRVLIPGGSGLIGRPLAAALAEAGYEVVILSRNPSRVENLPVNVQVERWDGKTAQGWGKLAEGATGIINLAGENLAQGRWTEERKEEIRSSRVYSGAAVVEAVEQARKKPSLVIQMSGTGYYGPHGDEILTEGDPPGNDFPAAVTLDWEGSTRGIEEMGVRRVVTRTGVVLSLDGGALPKLMLPFRMLVGGPIGSGKQWLSWIHIDDVVEAMRFFLEHDMAQGNFNLTSPTPVRYRELARTLGRVMGRPSWMPVPAAAMQTLLGDMSTMLLDGQRVIPKRLQEIGFQFRYSDVQMALHDLLSKA